MIRPSNRASIRNISDYSPFGVQLSERTISGDGYRFGFQGQEMDDEISGSGNSIDFGNRMYNPRLGRWLTIDPLAARQPDQSPYKAFLNNPLIWNDPDGRDEYLTIVIDDRKSGKTMTIKVAKPISTKVMTDGTGSSVVHSNNYYDFETIVSLKIDKNGKQSASSSYKFIYDNGLKDFDLAFGSDNVESKFHTKSKTDGNSWGLNISLEGNGETQNGGYTLTSKSGGVSSTKTKSLSAAEEIEIGEFLDVLGALKNGSYGTKGLDQLNDLSDMFKKVKEVKSNSEKSTIGTRKPILIDPVTVSESVPNQQGSISQLTWKESRKDAEKYYNGKIKNDTLLIKN